MKIWGMAIDEEIVEINLLNHSYEKTKLGNEYIFCPVQKESFLYTGQETCPYCGLQFEIQEILPFPGETRL